MPLPRALMLFRALMPSWRFFEDVGALPVLEHRCFEGGEPSSWERTLPPQPRSGSHLFFNPLGNLQFAKHSAVELLFSDAQELEIQLKNRPRSVLSYELVARLVAIQKMESSALDLAAQKDAQFQFRMIEDQSPFDLLFLSEVHSFEEILGDRFEVKP